jgi:hypothetical protein
MHQNWMKNKKVLILEFVTLPLSVEFMAEIVRDRETLLTYYQKLSNYLGNDLPFTIGLCKALHSQQNVR